MDPEDYEGQEEYRPPAAAAVAAAAAAAANDDDSEDAEDMDEGHAEGANVPGLEDLVRALRDIARFGGHDPRQAVDRRKVRIVLEAVGGDLDLAATLYWDDFLATAGAQAPHDANLDEDPDHRRGVPGDAAVALAAAEHPGGAMPEDLAANANRAAAGLVVDDGTPVARRLDDAFDRHWRSADIDHPRGRRAARGQRSRSQSQRAPLRRAGRLGAEEALLGEVARRSRSLPFRRVPLPQAAADPESDVEIQEARAPPNALPNPPPPPPAPPLPGAPAGGAPAGGARLGRGLGGGADPPVPGGLPERNLNRPPELDDEDAAAMAVADRVAAGAGGLQHERDAVDRLRRLLDEGRQRFRLAARHPHRRAGAGAAREISASVSDDEAGAARGGRTARRPAPVQQPPTGVASPRQHKRPRTDTPDDPSTATPPPHPTEVDATAGQPEQANEPDAATCYVSDDDWIWDGLDRDRLANGSRTVSTQSISASPADLLWGGLPASGTAADPDAAESSNVIVDDPADDAINPSSAKSGIPRTWLSAGFSRSECATGLCVKPPSEDDVTFFAWRQAHQNQNPRNVPPPPYHCRSVTSILSLVTAAMYTGATVQTDQVTTASSRSPFAQLPPEQRKREFDARLADALSALLWIAVQASLARKTKALEALAPTTALADDNDDNEERRRWGTIQRRLELVPTCHWEVDPGTGELRLDEATRCLPVRTSLANRRDVRCYVLSNLKSFTSSGGVALFLETILKIHGHGAVRRMMEQQQNQKPQQREQHLSPSPTHPAGHGSDASPSPVPLTGTSRSLIRCTCEEQYGQQLRRMRTAGTSAAASTTDSTPPGTQCITIELVSLLLTGRVYSTWHGWDTGPLELGLLTSPRVTPATHFPGVGPSVVGKGLSRPKQPVWILQGPTCYSTLWMSRCQDNASTFAYRDVPGAVAHFGHWNAWYGLHQRNLTTFRLSVGRTDPTSNIDPQPIRVAVDGEYDEDRKPPAAVSGAAAPRPVVGGGSVSLSVRLLRERRRDRAREKRERSGPEPLDPGLAFDPAALERVKVHPQDRALYPHQHTLWRYDLGEEEDVPLPNLSRQDDLKVRAQRWTPYHRLSDREKLLVEATLGPSLKVILFTRWPPSSVLERVEPADPPPIV